MELETSKMTQKWLEFGKIWFENFARQCGKLIISAYGICKDVLFNTLV